MSKIHPTAIIDENAILADDVEVGPYSIIGPNVVLKERVKLHSHVCIEGFTKINEGTEIYQFSSIGYPPQDLKYQGESSELIIGKNNIIREYTTIHPGTAGGGMKTTIGDNCLFMIGVHIAHDCIVGHNVIMANNATLAGHVVVGDYAIIGGLSAIHQFVRVGEHSIVGGVTAVVEDIIPFGNVKGDRARLAGLNLTGVKRRNFSKSAIRAIRNSYDKIFTNKEGVLDKRVALVAEEYADVEEVMQIVKFLQSHSTRSICLP